MTMMDVSNAKMAFIFSNKKANFQNANFAQMTLQPKGFVDNVRLMNLEKGSFVQAASIKKITHLIMMVNVCTIVKTMCQTIQRLIFANVTLAFTKLQRDVSHAWRLMLDVGTVKNQLSKLLLVLLMPKCKQLTTISLASLASKTTTIYSL